MTDKPQRSSGIVMLGTVLFSCGGTPIGFAVVPEPDPDASDFWTGMRNLGATTPVRVVYSPPSRDVADPLDSATSCRCHGDGNLPGRVGTARLASRSASTASKVIQIGRSPLSHAHRAAVSPP